MSSLIGCHGGRDNVDHPPGGILTSHRAFDTFPAMISTHWIAQNAFLIVPILCSFIMFAVEWKAEPLEPQARWLKIGWDLTVLALGLQGGFLVEKHSLNEEARSLGEIVLLVILFFGAVIAVMRHSRPPAGWQGGLSAALGGGSLALGIAWVVHYTK